MLDLIILINEFSLFFKLFFMGVQEYFAYDEC
jgi:hypothetical protein